MKRGEVRSAEFGHGIGQLATQCFQRTMEMRAHGSRGFAEQRGRLVEREAFQVDEDKDRALGFGQSRDRGADSRAQGGFGGLSGDDGVWHEHAREARAHCDPSTMVGSAAGENPEEPALEGGGVA